MTGFIVHGAQVIGIVVLAVAFGVWLWLPND